MNTKMFRSPGEDLHVSSKYGHTALITKEFIALPQELWSMAYAAGAVSEEMKDTSLSQYVADKKKEAEDEAAIERARVKSILKGLYDNPAKVVDNAGKISHRKAIVAIGSPIKKDLLDAIWQELTDEDK